MPTDLESLLSPANAAYITIFDIQIHLQNSQVKFEYEGHSSGQGQGHDTIKLAYYVQGWLPDNVARPTVTVLGSRT